MLDNVAGVVDNVTPVACNVFVGEMSWDVDRHEVLDDVVEMVEVLDMVAAEFVVDKDTSVVVWAVVVAVGDVVMNTAKDTSWLLGKSNKVDVCM